MWCIAQTMGLDVAHSGSLCLAIEASDWSRWLQCWPLIGWKCPCWPPLARLSGIFMSGSCNNKSRSDWIPAWLIRSEIPLNDGNIFRAKNCLFGFHSRSLTARCWEWILLMIAHPAHVCIDERILNIYCCKEAILLIKRTSDDSWNKRSLNSTLPLTGAW